eukprot:CAMPEP_0185838788 /NCGR_PEP_ID=MMETSP1353-20130828/13578_1 /TAXON_ID=1077150 /ORGANISM="Erythrolobus australicus, Strain CCMP3124" /LENGTH=66 /DNA_ID=CAMNT_0028537877 /DNA_START=68 /DNA_END=265 /DNA_ORIENTATION=-
MVGESAAELGANEAAALAAQHALHSARYEQRARGSRNIAGWNPTLLAAAEHSSSSATAVSTASLSL